jgi:hypothetical protein
MGESVNVWHESYFPSGPLYDEKDDLPEQAAADRRRLQRPSGGRGGRLVSTRELPTPGSRPYPAGDPVKFQWMEREAARTQTRFHEKVVAQFISPQNIAYLKSVFEKMVPAGQMRIFAVETLADAVYNYDRAVDAVESDPIAQRGENRVASDMWSEVRRLNRLFFADRMKLLREQASMIEKGDRKMKRGPRDFTSDEDESYGMRMFIADSLRPPGLEHMNTPGPLYALREDQANSERAPPGRGGQALRELFESKSPDASANARPWQGLHEDDGWGEGNPNRTPSQAIEEYWGDGFVESQKPPTEGTMLGAQDQWNVSYGELYGWGEEWMKDGGTRFMRYERPPFWQKGGREGYDYEIQETLGTAARELDSDVRRWDLDRVRKPRGEEYRRYGARNGSIV